MKQTREIIVRLLSSMSSRREVEQYLKRFSSVESNKFAVVKVGGQILREQLDELASALTFLQRVGLYPIVVHGAGPQLNAALDEAGIETRRIGGMRVTQQDTLEVARRVFQQENLRLVEALERYGTRARPITSGVFEATLLDEAQLGFVGEVNHVHLDPIRSAIRSETLPILASLGETQTGQIVNINADVAARQLALEIEPFKIIFLTDTGGILDADERLISSVNLAEDFDELMEQPWLHSGMRLKVRQIKELLERLPHSSSVSITRPEQMARELFTHQGSGTLVRRGERVERWEGWEGVDRPRLRELLERCFGRALADDYFDSKTPRTVFVTESYRATAVVTELGGLPYLDKFAVTPQAQGEGLGGSVWTRMTREFDKLFWRSRVGNPINGWYFSQAEGSWRQGDWVVFWYGLRDHAMARECIDRALALEPSLAPPTDEETT